MSSIYPNNGTLYYSIRYKDASGKKKRYSESLKLQDTQINRLKAEEIRLQRDRTFRQLKYRGSNKITLEAAKELFLKTKTRFTESTYTSYQYAIEKFISYIGADHLINEIYKETLIDYEHYLNSTSYFVGKDNEIEKKYSKHTIKSLFRRLRYFFIYLHQKGYVKENPVYLPNAPRVVVRVMTDEELTEILDHFKETNLDHYNFLNFLNLTGFRISEAVSLRWEDVDMINKRIIVKNKKANREELFPIYAELEKFIFTLKVKKKGNVFKYTSINGLNWLAKQLRKFTEGKYLFHDFRRKFGTRWASKLQAMELKQVMRHEDIQTTLKYYIGLRIDDITKKMQ